MKYYTYCLILLLMFVVPQAQAGFVEKCVDSKTGKVTYTDKGCKGKETSEDPYLGDTASSKRESNLKKTSVAGYRVSEIGILTEQAVDKCAKQAAKYFADSRPGVTKISKTEFLSVIDRSIRGPEVEIVLSGVIRYQAENADSKESENSGEKMEKQSQELKIQCSAKRRRDTEWVLVFKDADDNGVKK